MVIDSSLFIIFAYKTFHRNTLFSDDGYMDQKAAKSTTHIHCKHKEINSNIKITCLIQLGTKNN